MRPGKLLGQARGTYTSSRLVGPPTSEQAPPDWRASRQISEQARGVVDTRVDLSHFYLKITRHRSFVYCLFIADRTKLLHWWAHAFRRDDLVGGDMLPVRK